MLASCLGFFSLRTSSHENDTRIKESDNSYQLASCVFCDVSRGKGFDVVWEDDAFIVFNDRSPASEHHLLVITKRHVESVKTLKPSDAQMVARMAQIGHNVLDGAGVPAGARRLGFHIPPFNSINHLHLHVQGLPYKSMWRRAKYLYRPGGDGKEKGFGWFVEVEQTIRVLEKGGSVGVMPC